MSTIEVNKIIPQSGTDVQVGESGDTVTIPSGATFDASNATTTLPSTVVTTDGTQTLTNKTINGSQLVNSSVTNAKLAGSITNDKLAGSIANNKLENSSITINGTAVTLGGSTTIPTGLTWESKSSAFTAEAGKAYYVDTSSAAFTATLPASPTQDDEVRFLDVSGTFDTNNLTVGRNSENIQGEASDLTVATERAGFSLVYYNSTQGWLLKDK